MSLTGTWQQHAAIPLSGNGAMPEIKRLPAALDAAIAGARVIFLGETNHFVHEKAEFRYCWLSYLARHYPIVIVEELSRFDGQQVNNFLRGDEDALAAAATFGGRGHVRPDRDDSPQGIFGQSPYPYDLMYAEHKRLYQQLRNLPNIQAFVGFDIDAPGAAYASLFAAKERSGLESDFWQRLARVPSESINEEVDRLTQLLHELSLRTPVQSEIESELQAIITSLRYAAMIQHAADYESARPAMAYREEIMKQNIEKVLQALPAGTRLVMMAHAFHLARDDTHIEGQGVGPGGDQVNSIGHHVHKVLDQPVASFWMLYGRGEDSQPLPGLSNRADYPADSLNQALANQFDQPSVLPTPSDCTNVPVGHLYNMVARVNLSAEADAVTFFPEVHPLRTG
ncbi:MAG: hypothetical protein ACFHX7_17840 [Pseudomonadota bacterium]